MQAGVFEMMAQDLRELLRALLHGRPAQPTAAILDSRTVQSTPEGGSRAGYDGYKLRKGSKIHAAVDTLGHLLCLAGNGVRYPESVGEQGCRLRRPGRRSARRDRQGRNQSLGCEKSRRLACKIREWA